MKTGKLQSTRPTIGLLIGRLEESYQARVWPGIADYAQEHDVNLILFVGKSPRSPYGYEYQYNSIYKIINKNFIDGLVVVSGIIGKFLSKKELEKFYRQFKSIPVVSIALEVKGIPSVIVDNESGMRQALIHLIEKHHYEKIAFIRGPTTHQEAEQRFQTYVTILQEYNLPVKDELIVIGDLDPQAGADAVRTLLDERQVHFDALVAANDGMALSALTALQARGIKVPEEVAVVGFDDIDEASYVTPPLSTVKQPLYEQAKTAIRILLDKLEGNKVSSKICLPTTFIARESCGCFHESAKDKVSVKRRSKSAKKKDMEYALKKIRTPILNEVMKSFSSPFIEQDKFVRWLKNLIDKLTLDLSVNGEIEQFTPFLNEILIQKKLSKYQYNFWQQILSVLKENFLLFLKEYDINDKIEYLFEQGFCLLRELMMRALYYRRIQVEYELGLLGEVSQALITTIDISELMNAIALEVPKLNIQSCYIVIYNQDYLARTSTNWKVPTTSELVLAFDRQKQILMHTDKRKFRTRELLPDRSLTIWKRRTFCCMPLFFREEKLGHVLFELGPKEGIIYETLRSQISSALKGALLFQKHLETEEEMKKILSQLERTNKELQNLSLRDELTGLYNRRAFITLGEQHLRLASRTKRIFLLFFADMDGLKSINDTYGHREGDVALMKGADILKQSFREADIIARFGGDEFTIVAIDAGKDDVTTLKLNLLKNIKNYNKTSKKPYKLGISMGFAVYNNDSSKTFENLIS
ncbi:MAG: GGDEF domain-containing protein, partial [Spirochaetales bacterium]|nr:GGDEF domain-containing protein [Spirochaetales bacterium]